MIPPPYRDPWVDEEVAQVHEQVDEYDCAHQQQRERLRHRDVTDANRDKNLIAHPRDSKHGFEHNVPRDQGRDQEPEDRDDGDEGIAEDVADNDHLAAKPLGPRGAHVVLPQHLKHA